jgi:hypothetical protein
MSRRPTRYQEVGWAALMLLLLQNGVLTNFDAPDPLELELGQNPTFKAEPDVWFEAFGCGSMAGMSEPSFRHRKNTDGTWESICIKCGDGVARAWAEENLRNYEAEHTCFPPLISDIPN